MIALASLAALIVYNRSSHDEISQLREELRASRRRTPAQARSSAASGRSTLERQLRAQPPRPLQEGIFMLAAGREGFCTAFAVRPSVLVTNAHCITAASAAAARSWRSRTRAEAR